MDINKIQKLEKLLQERSKKIESIRHFDEYFERFAHFQLKNILNEVNNKLYDYTNESLRLFFEDPYDVVKTRHFVMIQLISEHNRRSHFYLDNTRHFPSLTFEGDEISGTVKITTKIKANASSGSELEIGALDEDKIFDLILRFLDNVYKI
ncbi:hypothetical protein [Mesonia oceanica]|uniref:Uncharacterized protein n=1 Tax=Mesonia oceanica TaxID=2687242 RepID=A0AC61Y914_9FLAO|nr:hypothetical protein [Mesonia oceanica]MAQ39631.1 hypothetical protein [Mesonia sp.]MBJ98248.1 hypothetical protein [Flavobacteriaceae bacterium]MBJ98788.1 hypothetical protein [Flavobacteriaceae bacterium]VVV00864.1 hypothetical protein FVB9532_02140 [Mesonia oceanica]|tara:strand:+ start:107 stop:559 length:453 start_codon:yes stop_codon:yes gene_type:complete